jgi:hypothetical protein
VWHSSGPMDCKTMPKRAKLQVAHGDGRGRVRGCPHHALELALATIVQRSLEVALSMLLLC